MATTVINAPVSSDVTATWNGSTNVPLAFNNSASNVYALATATFTNLAGASASTPHVYSSAMELTESNGLLGGSGLTVGSVWPLLISNGLENTGDALRFRIVRNNITLIDQTFTSNAAINTYFTDTVFNLGIAGANLNGADLDVQLLLDLTTSTAGDGVSPTLLLGNPSPAPGAGAFETGTFSNNAGGSLSLPTNYLHNTLVNGPGTTAIFSSTTTTSRTLTLDGNVMFGSAQFSGSANFAVAAGTGGTLTLENAGSIAAVTVAAQQVSVTAPIVLAPSGVSVTTANGGSLNLSGGVSGTGGINLAGGAMTLGGVNTYSGPTSILGGTFTLAAGHSGHVVIQNLNALSVSGAGLLYVQSPATRASHTLVLASTLSDTGTIDLTLNDMDITGASLSSVNALVATGFHGGTWTGTGVTSSTAAGDSTHLTALAVIQNNQSGTALFTAGHPFDTTVPGPSDILIRYTYYGDANLDGQVNSTDYTLIDNGYLHSLTGWFNGDFNYDGTINGSDYTLIDNAFNTQGAVIAAANDLEVARPTAQVATPSNTSVPEPGGATMVISSIALLSRRRSRRISLER